ncbi:tetratricopeptide repeat protein [Stutzerimonas stutzeri]|uniref:tetratricopeptide repeat protein n=1 Tax=Stutzerimonas stutzeri TaxID=316 RepID=UPI002109FE56|nr:tetratricopeptide repeat protein [Stutzerimonas stutzeri]
MPQGDAALPGVILPAPEEKPVTVDVSLSAVADPATLFVAFNAALAADQLPQAHAVIGEARLALGDSHLMVARMEGYYCMIAQCLQQARQAYATILTRLPQDREAGYNLAVLDWKAGHQAEARKRVRTLLAQHPGDEQLRALQRLMGASR